MSITPYSREQEARYSYQVERKSSHALIDNDDDVYLKKLHRGCHKSHPTQKRRPAKGIKRVNIQMTKEIIEQPNNK
jgi:hypothetical protein